MSSFSFITFTFHLNLKKLSHRSITCYKILSQFTFSYTFLFLFIIFKYLCAQSSSKDIRDKKFDWFFFTGFYNWFSEDDVKDYKCNG